MSILAYNVMIKSIYYFYCIYKKIKGKKIKLHHICSFFFLIKLIYLGKEMDENKDVLFFFFFFFLNKYF